jgi:Sigma-70 region 2
MSMPWQWRSAEHSVLRPHAPLRHLALFFALRSRGHGAESPPVEGVDQLDFEAFVHRYEYDIFTYLWRMTGLIESAYDLSQETFLRAWQQYDNPLAAARPARGGSSGEHPVVV